MPRRATRQVHPPLAPRCQDAFALVITIRGEGYVAQGRVLRIANGDGVEATVRGSGRQRYRVRLTAPEPGEALVRFECECPYAAALEPCKHMWAVALTVDQRGLGASFPDDDVLDVLISNGHEELLLPGGESDRWEAAFDDDDEEDEEENEDEDEDDAEDEGFWDEDEDEDDEDEGFGDQEDQDEDDDREAEDGAAASVAVGGGSRRTHPDRTAWRTKLARVPSAAGLRDARPTGLLPQPGESSLEMHLHHDTAARSELKIELAWRRLRRDGTPGVWGRQGSGSPTCVLTAGDVRALELVGGSPGERGYGRRGYYSYAYGYSSRDERTIPKASAPAVLEQLCAWGRFGWVDAPDDARRLAAPLQPLLWDGELPYAGSLVVGARDDGGLDVHVAFERDGEVLRHADLLVVAEGVAVLRDRVVIVDAPSSAFMIALGDGATIPEHDVGAFLEALASSPELPALRFEPSTGITAEPGVPSPRASVDGEHRGSARMLPVTVEMIYREQRIAIQDPAAAVWDGRGQRLILRERGAERRHAERLGELGFHTEAGSKELTIAAARFDAAVCALLDEGWDVRASRRPVRRGEKVSLSVQSGQDWFEIHGEVELGDATLELPELLTAVKASRRWVKLGDGSFGVLPSTWLARFERLASGKVRDGALRYSRAQGPLLDAALADLAVGEEGRGEADVAVAIDAGLLRLRRELERFDRIKPRRGPRSIQATLRPYQQLGLGWLAFLQKIGFGGCLADDMGLGKTIQVLALLDGRRKEKRCSLVVAPRSLLFNWAAEAARFAPKLRVSTYHGPGRHQLLPRLDEHDVVLTTYATLRLDIERLAARSFDYVVLDEAQAIKNPRSKITQACLRIDGAHRLALTGTPIENSLADLASILEFLNNGMVDGVEALHALSSGRDPSDAERSLLARALRPFILRRTKTEVLADLPDKTEQVLRCELAGKERRRYDELLHHYRTTLKERIDRDGLSRSKIHVLEALLRLRQAACHPGLLDPERAGESSAKLDTLLTQLGEIGAAGHKALIFSQFTTLLGIVRSRLDDAGRAYAYLDGKTRRRAEVVERFQNDPACGVFLLSLKAGGTGLNLTAAGYVFLLDPWWNPAVEAQAIDRSHRIGQTRPVMAYRLVAKDTVEDKILELQRHKRKLAEDILAADKRGLGALEASDLDVLLG